MYRQVGDAWDLGPEGELRRGLLVRMLVLPEGLAGIEENLAWIARNLAPTVTISLLAQYRPAHRVPRTPDLADLDRGVNRTEWQRVVAALEENMKGDRHHVQERFDFEFRISAHPASPFGLRRDKPTPDLDVLPGSPSRRGAVAEGLTGRAVSDDFGITVFPMRR